MADAPKTRKFIVRKDRSIYTDGGKFSGGSVVELTSAEAKHFNKLDMIAPFIEDDAADEEGQE
jgi:hypothetical protein